MLRRSAAWALEDLSIAFALPRGLGALASRENLEFRSPEALALVGFPAGVFVFGEDVRGLDVAMGDGLEVRR